MPKVKIETRKTFTWSADDVKEILAANLLAEHGVAVKPSQIELNCISLFDLCDPTDFEEASVVVAAQD